MEKRKITLREFAIEQLEIYKKNVAAGIQHNCMPFEKKHLKKLRKELKEMPEEEQIGRMMEIWKDYYETSSFIDRETKPDKTRT